MDPFNSNLRKLQEAWSAMETDSGIFNPGFEGIEYESGKWFRILDEGESETVSEPHEEPYFDRDTGDASPGNIGFAEERQELVLETMYKIFDPELLKKTIAEKGSLEEVISHYDGVEGGLDVFDELRKEGEFNGDSYEVLEAKVEGDIIKAIWSLIITSDIEPDVEPPDYY